MFMNELLIIFKAPLIFKAHLSQSEKVSEYM